MAKLRIKADRDLKELEKFGFQKYCEVKPTWRSTWGKYSKDFKGECYTEIGYEWDNGTNYIQVVEERKNNDWHFSNEPRDILVDECDYDMGVSMDAYCLVFDLIQADLVEKVEEGE